MAKFCGKCGSKLEEATGLCPNCNTEHKKQETSLNKNGKKRKRLLRVIACILLIGCVIGGLSYFRVIDLSSLSGITDTDSLGDINDRCIVVHKKEIRMENETEGRVDILIEMPDYEQLFQEALTSDNPDQALRDALISGKYQIRKYEETAKVTVDDGVTVVHSDEVVDLLLEEMLIEAINALSEVEK